MMKTGVNGLDKPTAEVSRDGRDGSKGQENDARTGLVGLNKVLDLCCTGGRSANTELSCSPGDRGLDDGTGDRSVGAVEDLEMLVDKSDGILPVDKPLELVAWDAMRVEFALRPRFVDTGTNPFRNSIVGPPRKTHAKRGRNRDPRGLGGFLRDR